VSPSLPRSAPRRILLIQKGHLGDVTLTTALLDDLHRAFPEAAIDFGVGRIAAPLLAHHPLIRERVIVDTGSALAVAPSVRARHYDWIVDVQSSPRTALLSLLSGAKVRAGWRVTAWHVAYTHVQTRDLPPEYMARSRRRILELLGVPVGDTPPRLHLTSAEREAGERVMAAAGAPRGVPRAGLLLDTAERSKTWPVAHFAALVPLLRASGIAPMVFDAPGDDERIARLRAAVPDTIVLPRLELRAFMGALAACQVLISGDTGPAHIADALGVPRVTIFGSTFPEIWAPARSSVTVVASANPPVLAMNDRKRELRDRDDYTADVLPARVHQAVRAMLGR
jgi:heptosyltransferase III